MREAAAAVERAQRQCTEHAADDAPHGGGINGGVSAAVGARRRKRGGKGRRSVEVPVRVADRALRVRRGGLQRLAKETRAQRRTPAAAGLLGAVRGRGGAAAPHVARARIWADGADTVADAAVGREAPEGARAVVVIVNAASAVSR